VGLSALVDVFGWGGLVPRTRRVREHKRAAPHQVLSFRQKVESRPVKEALLCV